MSASRHWGRTWWVGVATPMAVALVAGAAGGAGADRPVGRSDRAATATVHVMIAGRSRVLFSARTVRAGAVTVRAGRRRCRVPAASPLAALAAAGRAGGPSFSIRDYASCSRSARDAGGLFVNRIGPDRNRGRAGWVYKVDSRLGTSGAADPRGPFGTGRGLTSGQRLLWFWCTDALRCQRTLAVSPAANSVRPGERVPVTVYSFDDRGRRAPAARAQVSLGAAVAISDSAGHAQLSAPSSAGPVSLRAAAPGLVPAFPVTVDVR